MNTNITITNLTYKMAINTVQNNIYMTSSKFCLVLFLAALKVKLKRPFPVSVTKQGLITGRTLGHHHQPVLDLTATAAAASSAYSADGTFRENEMCRM